MKTRRSEADKTFSFAVLLVPDFPLQARVRLEKDLERFPCVLLEEAGRKVVAIQADAAAQAKGVVPGMSAPQVLARCPEAILRTRSAQAEGAAREVLLATAFMLSPRVEETGAGVCTIDLEGVLRQGLLDRGRHLLTELRKTGLIAKIGFASNPLRAFYAAQAADSLLAVENEREFFAGLPLAMADPPAHLHGILRQWGVHTLGAFAALPRQQIASRLGVEGIALWDRANGRCDRVLKLANLPEEFEESVELEHEVERLEPLMFLLRRLIEQLMLRLASTYQVAEEVKLTLGMNREGETGREVYERIFRLPEPSGDSELIFRMLHTHLENVRTEHPIAEVRLWVKPCRPVVKQNDFFEAAVKDPYGFSETLARLAAVVGSENVGSPRLEATHRPDAFRLEPLQDVGAQQGDFADRFDEPAVSSPMRRFRPPLPARVWLGEGRPVHLKSDRIEGHIQSASGPWRLSGNWWDQRQHWRRDEWDVELAGGGRYRLVRERKAWFVEGEF